MGSADTCGMLPSRGVRVPFRLGAKYFSSGLGGVGFNVKDWLRVDAKAWWMQEFQITSNGMGTWPAGCYSLGNRRRARGNRSRRFWGTTLVESEPTKVGNK